MNDEHWLTIAELAKRIEAREVSPVEVTRAQLARIAALDDTLNAYALLTDDAALAAAQAAETEIASGTYRGPLHGVPLGIKDLFWTKGVRTSAGTRVHDGFIPDEDATAVARLKQAGAVVLGKAQMTEGAYSDHHPSVTVPLNPWNAAQWSGISSSGSGVATAAGLCYGSLGSDTGGSIRWPCAANGLTGLKPTWGRVSRHGVFGLAPSLDHVGPMARSAVDVALLLQVIAGADPRDPTAARMPVPDFGTAAAQGLEGLRLGIDPAWSADVDADTRAAFDAAVATVRDLGAVLVELPFPDPAQAIADWFTICASEAALAHEATYPARKADYGEALAAAIEAGLALSALELQRALMRRLAFRGQVDALFAGIDVLLTPVQPFAAPTFARMHDFVEDADLVADLARYTCAFDMTGHPCLALPGGFTGAGLPIGLQFVAGAFDEVSLLRAGAAFQAATDWHRRHPAL